MKILELFTFLWDSFRVKNKNIIITGGASGIGLASAKLFAEKNYNVYVLDQNECGYKIKNIKSYICDVSDYFQVNKTISEVVDETKKIDAVFANAGIHFNASLEETNINALNEIIDVNIKGVFFTLKSVLPFMKKQNNGAIVITGSEQAQIGKKSSAAYGLTKAAIAQLAKSTALDYAPWNIRVNCICPGATKTPLYDRAMKERMKNSDLSAEDIIKYSNLAIPLQRIGKPEEIAELVYFLCSEKSQYITGASISIDGGYCAQ